MKVKEILGRTSWIPSKMYEEQKPEVSILLPTWKQAQSGLFTKAVQSVLNQTFTDFELIIIDDASTDGTFDLIQKFMAEDPRVNCIRHLEYIGLPAISEYEGYLKSRGDYFAFLFDDDEWDRGGLEKLVNYAEQNNIKAVAGKYLYFVSPSSDINGSPSDWITMGGGRFEHDSFLSRNELALSSVLLHRDVFNKVGLFDPNLILLHHYDWDFLFRVSKDFRFDVIDDLIGKANKFESFAVQRDIQNQFRWALTERMNQPRSLELLPAHFDECDILEPSLQSSPYLYRCILWRYDEFSDKKWYDKRDKSAISIKDKSYAEWHGKRVYFISAGHNYTGSTMLYWGRLPYSDEMIICYASIGTISFSDILFADLIAIERNLLGNFDQIIQFAKGLNIPVYYFVDDNFIALASCNLDKIVNKDEIRTIKALARKTNADTFANFAGVICSTLPLCEFFERHRIFIPCHLFNPIYISELATPFNPNYDSMNVLYFGNSFRSQLITEIVIPAILKLSTEMKIDFICPEDLAVIINELVEKKNSASTEHVETVGRLKVTGFQRRLSLNQTIRNLSKYKIHVQIHPNIGLENDKYKSVNALLNATSFGAVLVGTRSEPFTLIEEVDDICVLTENTIDAWHAALIKVVNEGYRRKVYKNALAYCKKEFNPMQILNNLMNAFSTVSSTQLFDFPIRMSKYAVALKETHQKKDPHGLILNLLLNAFKSVYNWLIRKRNSFRVR